jgi:hypothetical protein
MHILILNRQHLRRLVLGPNRWHQELALSMLRPEVNAYWRVIASVVGCVRVIPLKWAGPRNLAGVNNWEGAFRPPTVTPPSTPEYCCLASPDIRLCLGNVLEPSLKQSGSFMALY